MKYFHFLFLSLLFSASFAQHTAMDKPTQAYLNLYVDYINANTHALRLYHRGFEKFNLLINSYYGQAPFDKESRLAFEAKNSKTLKFEAPNSFSDNTAFEILPEGLYQKIFYEPSKLSPEQLKTLQERVREVHDIANEIMNVGKNLEEYCLGGAYLNDEGLEAGYKFINRAEILFHDFSESKDLLYYEIKRVNNSFLQPNLNNPYTRSSNKLLTFILYARNCLTSLKKDDRATVLEQLPLMETAYNDLLDNQAKYLEGVKTQDVVDQYNKTTRKAEVFIKITKDYLDNPFMEPKYSAYGLEYYNYNNYFLNNYNRYGAGIIPEYNKFIEMSEVPLLKLPEEVHWLKIIPQPFRNDKPKKEEVVVKEEVIDSFPPPKPIVPKVEPKPEPIVVKDTVKPAPVIKEAKEIAGSAPVNFVLLLDVSGSMQMPYKLPLLKKSFKNLLSLLRPTDKIAIVVYSGNAKTVLNSTYCAEKDKIVKSIDNLQSAGESDVNKGTKLAFKVAEQNFLEDGNNRIILATDGGISLTPELLELTKNNFLDKSIYLSVFYFEEKEYLGKAEKLKQLATQAKGNYAYINKENADAMLLKEVNSVRRK